MRIRLSQLRKVIREIVAERHAALLERDGERMVQIFRDVARRIRQIRPESTPEEHKQVVQAIRDVASMDMGMGQRLLSLYKTKKFNAETGDAIGRQSGTMAKVSPGDPRLSAEG